jgi:hypothetical protein
MDAACVSKPGVPFVMPLLKTLPAHARTQGLSTPRAVFARQPAVTPAMRDILLQWVFEVVHVHRMDTETYLLAVNYLDRCVIGRGIITKCGGQCSRSSCHRLHGGCWVVLNFELSDSPARMARATAP